MAQTLCRREICSARGKVANTTRQTLVSLSLLFGIDFFERRGPQAEFWGTDSSRCVFQKKSKECVAWRPLPIEQRVGNSGLGNLPQIHYHKFRQQKVTPPLIGTVLTNTEELSQI
jgi:hypothetical protein